MPLIESGAAIGVESDQSSFSPDPDGQPPFSPKRFYKANLKQ
jgi:hypothetical protein